MKHAIRYIADWEKREMLGKSALEKAIDILQYRLEILTHLGVYRIYSEIVTRYHLYMYDLINIIHPLEVIKNNYEISLLPKFVDLPKLSLENNKFYYLLKSTPNPLDNKLTISIDFSGHLPIEEITEFVNNVIAYYVYIYNDLNYFYIDGEDYKYASLFLDSPNSHSRKDNFKERIDGLYLWDKLYRYGSLRTVNNEISIFAHNIKKIKFVDKKEENNFIRRYQRIVKSTKECIEAGQILPIVKSESKGGQPKPTAS